MRLANRRFWLMTFGAALLLAVIEYAPVLTGKIPFPSDFIFDFPPYANSAPPEYPGPHTNIGDLVTSFYPYHTLAARAAREWTLPLWNPYMLAGAPFLANTQSALFYPPNFLYYVLPVPVAWTVGFLLRRVLATLFMALFVRRIGGSPAGAILSGLLFAFCGFLTAWQGQAMHDAAIWLPLICYSIVRLLAEPDRHSVAIAAFAFAMPVLAGHPETAAHLTLTGIALAAVLLPGNANAKRFIASFVASGALALGLSSVQMLPTLEWLRNIHHSLGTWPPLPQWSMLALVSRDIIRSPNSIGLLYPEHGAYLAMFIFIAAPLALLHNSRRIVFFFVTLTAAGICVAYGIGPILWLVQQLPVLKFLKNARLILVASFGAAVLAGLGMTALEQFRTSQSPRRRAEAAILGAGGFIVAFLMVHVAHLLASELVEFVRLNRLSVFLLFASGLAVALTLMGVLKGRALQAALLLVVALDLSTVNRGAIPFTSTRDVFPSIELFDRLSGDAAAPFRVAQLGYAYGANFEVMYGISAVSSYEIALERIKTFLKDISRDEMDSVMLTTKGILETKDRRVDMLNAKYYIVSAWDPLHVEFRKQPQRFRFVFMSGDTEVYENLMALPAAFLVPATGSVVIPDDAGQLTRVKDPLFDPERQVVLDAAISQPDGPSDPAAPSGKIQWVSRRINDFELNVTAAEAGVLVISQIDYPGWKAYVDGQPVRLARANYALPAIPIPRGMHHVRFSFEPLSFRIGLLLSAIAVLVIALLSVGPILRSR